MFAGVSSFGFGGTNAHVVLTEAPSLPLSFDEEYLTYTETMAKPQPDILTISAQSLSSLQRLITTYKETIRDSSLDKRLADICYSAQQRRTHHPYRVAVVGETKQEIIEEMERIQRNKEWREDVKPKYTEPTIAFVFNGQGSQWQGMGKGLFRSNKVFRNAVQKCNRIFRKFADWSLIEELFSANKNSRLSRTSVAQPMIFAIQIALVKALSECGISPDAAVGHSLGEIAAYHVGGTLSLEDALLIIFERSRYMEMVKGKGKMAVVQLSFEEADEFIAPYRDQLSIAANNGPNSVMLSGASVPLLGLLKDLENKKVFYKVMDSDYAFHSMQMESICNPFEESLTAIRPKASEIPVYSTVYGFRHPKAGLTSKYWRRNVRQPVCFQEALEQCFKDQYDAYIEIGPHQSLRVVHGLFVAEKRLPTKRHHANLCSSLIHCQVRAIPRLGERMKPLWYALFVQSGQEERVRYLIDRHSHIHVDQMLIPKRKLL